MNEWLRAGAAGIVCAAAAWAQLPGVIKDKVGELAGRRNELRIGVKDEIRIGSDISARIRAQYGVAQDARVHRYVALTGAGLTARAGRPELAYTFIVLDTDGVNAFAAPGGYIHVTRGALALMKSEAELAGVLAHEIAHAARRHTVKAMEKGTLAQWAMEQGGGLSHPEVFRRLADEGYNAVFAGFGRADETDADEQGIGYAAGAGYDAGGLPRFLRALAERNAASAVRQGLFASHPELESRVGRLQALIQSRNWRGGAVLADRYARHIQYRPVPLAGIAVSSAGGAALSGGGKDTKAAPEKEKKSRFGLSRLKNPLGTGGQDRQSAAVTGSGGSRAVDKERSAKGGPHPGTVSVVLSAAEIAAFQREGRLGR